MSDTLTAAEVLGKANGERDVIIRESDDAVFVARDVAIEAMVAFAALTAAPAEAAMWRWKLYGGVDAWHYSEERPSFSPRDLANYVHCLEPLFTAPPVAGERERALREAARVVEKRADIHAKGWAIELEHPLREAAKDILALATKPAAKEGESNG